MVGQENGFDFKPFGDPFFGEADFAIEFDTKEADDAFDLGAVTSAGLGFRELGPRVAGCAREPL